MKKNISTSAKTNTSTSNVELEEKAISKFRSGQYKEAIECYKSLLKQTNNPEWREKLSVCYLRRSLALAEKGMTKEAAVFWENYTQNATLPFQSLDSYIIWQLQNNSSKIESCLRQLSCKQVDEEYPELAVLLGLLMLTDKPNLAKFLPPESQLLIHLDIANSAIEAYRNNAITGIEAALAKLPFRSAFRDFRTLLKAYLLPDSMQAQKLETLAKIPVTSPYHGISNLLYMLELQGSEVVKHLMTLPPKQRKLITSIKGFSKKQEELLAQIGLHHELTDKIKFGLAIKFQDVFGKEISENFCQATLATYPSGQRDFNKAFHLSTSNFQVKRFQALNAERDRDTYDAEQYWMEAIELLEKSDDTDKAYKIALILRHIAQFNTGIVAADWLKKSIVYDPDDRESYYKILQTYQQSGKADDRYKEWLDKSLVKFPQDLDFLRLVIEEALGKNTYKKAAQYAKSMLKIDPINTYAKQTLFRCYLAHARKLLISQKYHLVQNELNQAQALGLGKRCQNQVTILHGFLIYLGDNNNQGLPLVTEAVKKIDDSPVLRKFVLAMEAGLLKLATEPFVKLLDALPKKYQPSSEELTRLIELVNYYFQEDDNKLNLTHKALSPIKAVLKEAIKALAYNEAELLVFCQCLEKVKHFELLLYCAKIARTKWQNPIWLYYQFYAESDGVANNCKASNIEQLIDYLDRHGRDKKNERATVLIGQFVDLYYQSHAPNSFAPMFDESDMNDDPMEVFFDHLPRAILKKIDTKVNELSKKSPDKIMLMLSKLLPKKIDPMQVMQLMVFEPGLISVLLFLKAADELNIDTDVSIEEVLDYFDFDIHSNQPNLPFF